MTGAHPPGPDVPRGPDEGDDAADPPSSPRIPLPRGAADDAPRDEPASPDPAAPGPTAPDPPPDDPTPDDPTPLGEPPYPHGVLKSLLGAWALAACSAEETTAVEAHLSDCASCAGEALRLRDAVGLLHPEDSLDLDPSLRSRVLEKCLGRRPARVPIPEWAAPYDAETARLDALLRDMADAEWRAPVRLHWFDGQRPAARETTVAGVVAHLLAVDGLVACALGLPDPLSRLVEGDGSQSAPAAGGARPDAEAERLSGARPEADAERETGAARPGLSGRPERPGPHGLRNGRRPGGSEDQAGPGDGAGGAERPVRRPEPEPGNATAAEDEPASGNASANGNGVPRLGLGPTPRTERLWHAGPPLLRAPGAHGPWREQSHAMVRTASFAGRGAAELEVAQGGFTLPLRDALLDRAFECWVHGEDIARAVDYPYPLPEGRHLHLMVDLAARMLPGTIAWRRRSGLAPPARRLTAAGAHGRALHLEVEGDGGGDWYIPLDSPGAAASAEDAVAHVALDRHEFCQLAAGRVPPQDATVGQYGDREAVRDVLFAAASLSRL